MVRGILKLTDILFPGSKVVPWVSRYKLVCRVQVHIDVKRLCCYHPRNTAALISQDLDSVLHRAYSQGLGERVRLIVSPLGAWLISILKSGAPGNPDAA
jgi:hypothetical protein